MELDFERYCVIEDESPNTVLLPPEVHRISNRRKNLKQEFKEINFNRFRSFSCKTVANRASGLDKNELLKRGSVSVYQSSKENNCKERKKIEISRKSDAPFSFKILDSFCSSDEDEEQIKKNRGGNIACCSDEFLEFSLADLPVHSGINSSRPSLMMKRMLNSFAKSKSHKIQRNSMTRNSKSSEKSRMEICCSVGSSSSAHLHGFLKVRIRKGFPSFEFSVNSIEEDDVKWKAVKKNTTGRWVFEDCSKKPSIIIGEMQVSCKDNVVTEFVLYDELENSCCSSSSTSGLHPHTEIAAIVIETSTQKPDSILPTINIVIPAGSHSQPSSENIGPSPLLDRWRLNGGCECGGWDMACPITVLTNSTLHNQPQPRPLQLFFEGRGGKENEPGLSMKAIDGGSYSVDFQTRLSMLQTFSICIAILHCTDKRLLQADSTRSVQPPFALNPPFSPIGRV
ncbi:uncharacterized protein LOC124932118 [Impatiens glandulifera]|uniref:uncharacterized protein LOC124932118 n=1 Tax=Impatiens glandulifera TaxID=253017 RepID=UPI001FB0E7B8|nr:uncharacterized protein LOC124932118 [Impatiens glandulifera]